MTICRILSVGSGVKSLRKAKRGKGLLFVSNEICQQDHMGRIFGRAGRGRFAWLQLAPLSASVRFGGWSRGCSVWQLSSRAERWLGPAQSWWCNARRSCGSHAVIALHADGAVLHCFPAASPAPGSFLSRQSDCLFAFFAFYCLKPVFLINVACLLRIHMHLLRVIQVIISNIILVQTRWVLDISFGISC